MGNSSEAQRLLFRYIKALFDLIKTGQTPAYVCDEIRVNIATLALQLGYHEQTRLLGDFVKYMLEYELAVNVNQTPNLAHVQTNGRKVIVNPQGHRHSPVDYVVEVIHYRFPNVIRERRRYDGQAKKELEELDRWKMCGIRINPVKLSTDDEATFYMDTVYGSVRLGNAD